MNDHDTLAAGGSIISITGRSKDVMQISRKVTTTTEKSITYDKQGRMIEEKITVVTVEDRGKDEG